MPIDTHRFKQKLEEEKAALLEELEEISNPNPANPEDWDARADEENTETADLNLTADMHEEIEVRHGTSDVLEARLEEVNDALGRIEEGTYGICEEGDEEIEHDRLEANPAATTCKKHVE